MIVWRNFARWRFMLEPTDAPRKTSANLLLSAAKTILELFPLGTHFGNCVFSLGNKVKDSCNCKLLGKNTRRAILSICDSSDFNGKFYSRFYLLWQNNNGRYFVSFLKSTIINILAVARPNFSTFFSSFLLLFRIKIRIFFINIKKFETFKQNFILFGCCKLNGMLLDLYYSAITSLFPSDFYLLSVAYHTCLTSLACLSIFVYT